MDHGMVAYRILFCKDCHGMDGPMDQQGTNKGEQIDRILWRSTEEVGCALAARGRDSWRVPQAKRKSKTAKSLKVFRHVRRMS